MGAGGIKRLLFADHKTGMGVALVSPPAARAPTRSITQSVEAYMLRYAAIFLVIAIIAAVFGFGGIAAGATEIAKVLFFIFIVIFLVTLLMGVIRR
jgi:uncharacterized membrane protein YtjA (UPF0391 family)